MNERIKKMWNTNTIKYYSAPPKKEGKPATGDNMDELRAHYYTK